MRRREFIVGLGSAAASPLAAPAQQPPVIGILGRSAAELFASRLLGFRRGLNEVGFVEGRNVAFENRLGTNDQWSVLAAELVRLRVSVIVTMGGVPAASAAKAATSAIPIVFSVGVDPVKLGLVSSLNRPDANVTGVTGLGAEIGPKRLELLHKVVPAATTIGLLVNPTSSGAETISSDLRAAARLLGLQSRILFASNEGDFEKAFATLADEPARALVVSGDSFFNTRSAELAALAIRYAIPTISQFRDFAAAGGLISYGTSFAELDALAGLYAGRILKGERPADLPVLQPTKFEFVINMKTAKTLGLTIPETLLATADEVLQ